MRQISVKAILKLGALASLQSLALTSVLAAQPVSNFENETTATSTRRPAFVNTSDLASPNAEEMISDVQSAHSWSRFQRGEINGFRYVIFPDGEARIYGDQSRQVLRFKMDCTLAVSCVITGSDGQRIEVSATGADKPTRPAAENEVVVATYIAEWILAGSGAPRLEEDQKPVEMAQDRPQNSATEADAPEETTPSTLVETTTENATQSDLPDAQTAEQSAQIPNASSAERDTAAFDQEICSELGQFIPTTCAQSPSPLTNTATIKASIRGESNDTSQSTNLAEPTLLSFSEQYNLRCSITSTVNVAYEDADAHMHRPGKPRISLGCGASLTEQLSLRVSVLAYANPDQQADSDPDFTYALTYRATDTINISYTNYSARFDSETDGVLGALGDGNLRASFRLPKVALPNDKTVTCSASVSMRDPLNESTNLSCGYSVTNRLRLGATAYFYLPDRQAEFQPDFSYTAAYRINEHWLLSYSNYSNNRWHWKTSGNASSGLEDGSVALSYSFKF